MPADANALHMIERCEKYEKFSLASLVVMNQRTWILLVGTVWYSTCFVLHFIASISSNPCLRKAKEWQRQIRGESRRIDRDVSRMRAFIAVEWNKRSAVSWIQLKTFYPGSNAEKRMSMKYMIIYDDFKRLMFEQFDLHARHWFWENGCFWGILYKVKHDQTMSILQLFSSWSLKGQEEEKLKREIKTMAEKGQAASAQNPRESIEIQ